MSVDGKRPSGRTSNASGCGARCGTRPAPGPPLPVPVPPGPRGPAPDAAGVRPAARPLHGPHGPELPPAGSARVPAGLRRLHRVPSAARARARASEPSRVAAPLPRTQRDLVATTVEPPRLTDEKAGPLRAATCTTPRRPDDGLAGRARGFLYVSGMRDDRDLLPARKAAWSPSASRTSSRRRSPPCTATSSPTCRAAASARSTSCG